MSNFIINIKSKLNKSKFSLFCSQRFNWPCPCSLSCRYDSCYGSCHNHEDGGLYADADANGGVFKHLKGEEAVVQLFLSDGGVHVFIGGDAEHHADVSEERGDADALHDDKTQDWPRLGADGFADAEKGIDNYDSYSKESTLFGKFTTTSEKTEYLRGYKDGHDDGK